LRKLESKSRIVISYAGITRFRFKGMISAPGFPDGTPTTINYNTTDPEILQASSRKQMHRNVSESPGQRHWPLFHWIASTLGNISPKNPDWISGTHRWFEPSLPSLPPNIILCSSQSSGNPLVCKKPSHSDRAEMVWSQRVNLQLIEHQHSVRPHFSRNFDEPFRSTAKTLSRTFFMGSGM